MYFGPELSYQSINCNMSCITLLVIPSVIILALWLYVRYRLPKLRHKSTIAIFHLYCSSGGGGERVLWHTVEALVRKYPKYGIYIYTKTNKDQEDTFRILLKVRELFKIDLISDRDVIDKLEFVPLRFAGLIEARCYPFLTLFFQNFMSMLVALEAAYKFVPEIYMETIGFTFTLPIFKFLFNCTTMTYVHYPTISNDMIQNVRTDSHKSFNNREIFVKSPILRTAKLQYYKILAYLYGWAGRRADLVMVNSSWTQKHIESLWNKEAHVVYPPCDVESFKSIYSDVAYRNSHSKSLNIISIAQFRPEKNHQLQIEAFDSFLSKTHAHESKLTLYGGCRDEGDRARVADLRELINRLELNSNIDIKIGVPFDELLNGLKEADVAVHTMKNEHFGIVLLECMAAGLITIAHNSGGPKADIIDDNKSGFLAEDVDDFAENLARVSEMDEKDRLKIRQKATQKADQFSTQVFVNKFIRLVDPYLKK